MATPLGPGNYFIRLKDDAAAMFTDQGELVDATASPTFETNGDAVFNFTTEGTGPQGQPLVFEAPVITWRDPQNNPVAPPPHNTFQPNGTTILVLTVASPSAAQTVQFTLHLNGTIIDPTIVEKPPETTPLPDGQE